MSSDESSLKPDLDPVWSVLRLSGWVLGLSVVGASFQFFLPRNYLIFVGVPLISVLSLVLCVWWLRNRLNSTLNSLFVPASNFSAATAIGTGLAAGVLFLAVSSRVFPLPEIENVGEVLLRILATPLTPIGLSTILIAPLEEEILFRGIAFAQFRLRFGFAAALLGQAALSAVLHMDMPGIVSSEVILFRFALSCVLALLFAKTNSLYTCVACHSVVNWWAAAT